MASEVSNPRPTLAPHGPPAYVGRTAKIVMGMIYTRGLAVGNPPRAWWILGYIKKEGQLECPYNFAEIHDGIQDPKKSHQPSKPGSSVTYPPYGHFSSSRTRARLCSGVRSWRGY